MFKNTIFRRMTALVLTLALAAAAALPGLAVYPMPIQTASETEAVYLFNADTGKTILNQNADQQQYVASLTKLMTALLLLESGKDLNGEVTVPTALTQEFRDIQNANGTTMGLRIGETVHRIDLLNAMLIVSANDAASVIAYDVGGSVLDFVKQMNARAQELGCTGTHFVNPNGLHDPNHYSTAWDIYLFTREAMKYDEFMTIVNTKAYDVPATNKSEARELHSTNYLISNWRATGYLYSGAQGIKTGSTDAAGYCLVSSAVRTDRQLISVVLGARLMTASDGSYKVGSFTETARLFDWGFDNFTTKTVLTEDEMIQEVPVALSKETAQVAVHPAYTAEAVLPDDLQPEDLVRTVTLDADVVDAPVSAGQQLGTITLSYGDVDYATVPLLAVADVNASRFLIVKQALKEFFSRTIVKVLMVVLVILVVLVLLFGKTVMRRRRYGSGRGRRRRHRSYRGRRF